jgi:ATP-dependent helicase HrpB
LLPLPIDPFLEDINRRVRQARAAVIVAAPGAGKTTRVPPALALASGGEGPVIVLQPRRVAARAIAARIAHEQGWTLGGEVGWHVRFERRFSAETRVLLATEGILTARLLQDPLLSDFATIVLDEFHERSLHADIGLALARQAWRARDDLRIVVMSATIDPRPISAFLDNCPIVDVPGREHPVEIEYAPGETVARAVEMMLPRTTGTILCFLPGAPEIRREMTALARVASGVELLQLHGSLTAEEQDRAIAPAPPEAASRRRVILATNIAETSLTVPGVTTVIDSGWHKVARYDADRGIDSLELERISQASADQRAGRAGRLGPGRARRLWDQGARLRAQREPDIARIDLAATLLDLLAWGGDPDQFEWFDAPPRAAIDAAWALLHRLGAVEGGGDRQGDADGAPANASQRGRPRTPLTLTPLGRTLQRLPLHPRLGRILIAAAGSRDAARACALLAERHFMPARHEATTCDLLAAIDRWQDVPPHIHRVARELEELAVREAGAGLSGGVSQAGGATHGVSATNVAENARRPGDARVSGTRGRGEAPGRARAPEPPDNRHTQGGDAAPLRRAIFAGYADRVARRRAAGSPRVVLASGHGAVIAPESGVQDGEFIVALDVQAATTREGPTGREVTEARIRIASLVDRAWLTATARQVDHWFDAESGRVKAVRREMYDDLVLAEHPIEPDAEAAARVLADTYLARGLRDNDEQVVRRLRFAGRATTPEDVKARVEHACQAGWMRGTRTLDAIDLAAHLSHDDAREIARLAPDTLRVPSGRTARLEYQEDGSVSAAVKLQELFGLAETPRIGPRQTPVLLQLLAPNGRPVQTTRDLRSFWDRTYPEVRKELRGRYPKHPWPDDPWTATPTHRAKPRN